LVSRRIRPGFGVGKHAGAGVDAGLDLLILDRGVDEAEDHLAGGVPAAKGVLQVGQDLRFQVRIHRIGEFTACGVADRG
jgi:hypothetical protein